MADVRLKAEIEGNRRNIFIDGRQITIRKKTYIRIVDTIAKTLNESVYDIILDKPDAVEKEKLENPKVKVLVKPNTKIYKK